jgi:hypothetical protein
MKRTQTIPLAMMVVAATQMGATDCGQVLKDPGFDLWCGETLCSWKLVRGDIERVGTWHSGDSGVSFLGTDSAIQQVSPVNSFDGSCITFTMVANVNPGVEAFLDIDLDADGTVERRERIPSVAWQPVTLYIRIEGLYDGIRFELGKTGNGEAVLANMGAELFAGGCDGIEPITPAPRANGASCSQGPDCASGVCATSQTGFNITKACAECDATHACEAGDVCGLGAPLSPVLAVPTACVPTGAKELAEQCIEDAECASGVCVKYGPPWGGICSSCRSADDCGTSNTECAPAWQTEFNQRGPSICLPGRAAGATGAPCGTDADCASGTCSGSERKTCIDGRECQTPGDCPVLDGLSPDACTTVGIQGGTCT